MIVASVLTVPVVAWGQGAASPAGGNTVPARGNTVRAGGSTAAGEAPLDTPSAQGAGDKSALASPVAPLPRGTAVAVGTEIRMTIGQEVSSGAQMNGDKFRGSLVAPVRTTSGAVLPQGTVVEGTVVSSAKAGLITSGGVLSLQVTRVGGVPVITDVVDFNGQEGHKDVADAAPAKGSEASVSAGAMLNFHVLEVGHATGLVPGVPPAQNAGGQGNAGQQGNARQGNAPAGVGPGIPQTPIHGATQGVTPR